MDCTQVLDDSELEETLTYHHKVEVAKLTFGEEEFTVFSGNNRIGRDPEFCTIVLNNTTLSKEHAVIEVSDRYSHIIYDLGSKNKTKLGKMRLTPHVRYNLPHKSRIQFGDVYAQYLILADEKDINVIEDSDDDLIPETPIQGSKFAQEHGDTNSVSPTIFELSTQCDCDQPETCGKLLGEPCGVIHSVNKEPTELCETSKIAETTHSEEHQPLLCNKELPQYTLTKDQNDSSGDETDPEDLFNYHSENVDARSNSNVSLRATNEGGISKSDRSIGNNTPAFNIVSKSNALVESSRSDASCDIFNAATQVPLNLRKCSEIGKVENDGKPLASHKETFPSEVKHAEELHQSLDRGHRDKVTESVCTLIEKEGNQVLDGKLVKKNVASNTEDDIFPSDKHSVENLCQVNNGSRVVDEMLEDANDAVFYAVTQVVSYDDCDHVQVENNICNKSPIQESATTSINNKADPDKYVSVPSNSSLLKNPIADVLKNVGGEICKAATEGVADAVVIDLNQQINQADTEEKECKNIGDNLVNVGEKVKCIGKANYPNGEEIFDAVTQLAPFSEKNVLQTEESNKTEENMCSIRNNCASVSAAPAKLSSKDHSFESRHFEEKISNDADKILCGKISGNDSSSYDSCQPENAKMNDEKMSENVDEDALCCAKSPTTSHDGRSEANRDSSASDDIFNAVTQVLVSPCESKGISDDNENKGDKSKDNESVSTYSGSNNTDCRILSSTHRLSKSNIDKLGKSEVLDKGNSVDNDFIFVAPTQVFSPVPESQSVIASISKKSSDIDSKTKHEHLQTSDRIIELIDDGVEDDINNVIDESIYSAPTQIFSTVPDVSVEDGLEDDVKSPASVSSTYSSIHEAPTQCMDEIDSVCPLPVSETCERTEPAVASPSVRVDNLVAQEKEESVQSEQERTPDKTGRHSSHNFSIESLDIIFPTSQELRKVGQEMYGESSDSEKNEEISPIIQNRSRRTRFRKDPLKEQSKNRGKCQLKFEDCSKSPKEVSEETLPDTASFSRKKTISRKKISKLHVKKTVNDKKAKGTGSKDNVQRKLDEETIRKSPYLSKRKEENNVEPQGPDESPFKYENNLKNFNESGRPNRLRKKTWKVRDSYDCPAALHKESLSPVVKNEETSQKEMRKEREVDMSSESNTMEHIGKIKSDKKKHRVEKHTTASSVKKAKPEEEAEPQTKKCEMTGNDNIHTSTRKQISSSKRSNTSEALDEVLKKEGNTEEEANHMVKKKRISSSKEGMDCSKKVEDVYIKISSKENLKKGNKKSISSQSKETKPKESGTSEQDIIISNSKCQGNTSKVTFNEENLVSPLILKDAEGKDVSSKGKTANSRLRILNNESKILNEESKDLVDHKSRKRTIDSISKGKKECNSSVSQVSKEMHVNKTDNLEDKTEMKRIKSSRYSTCGVTTKVGIMSVRSDISETDNEMFVIKEKTRKKRSSASIDDHIKTKPERDKSSSIETKRTNVRDKNRKKKSVQSSKSSEMSGEKNMCDDSSISQIQYPVVILEKTSVKNDEATSDMTISSSVDDCYNKSTEVGSPVIQRTRRGKAEIEVGSPIIQRTLREKGETEVGSPIIQRTRRVKSKAEVGSPIIQRTRRGKVEAEVGSPIIQRTRRGKVEAEVGSPIIQRTRRGKSEAEVGSPIIQRTQRVYKKILSNDVIDSTTEENVSSKIFENTVLSANQIKGIPSNSPYKRTKKNSVVSSSSGDQEKSESKRRGSNSRKFSEKSSDPDSPKLRKNLESNSAESICSSGESTPKRSCRLSQRVEFSVMFTGVIASKGNETAIRKLGGKFVNDINDCTVLITDKVRRTFKFLCILAQGKPIVTVEWLKQSQLTGYFLDPWDYIVKDVEAEKKFNFQLQQSLKQASVHKLLEGYAVFTTPSILPPPEEMKGIVESSGGKFLAREPSVIAWPEKSFVIATQEDKRLVTKFKKLSINVVSTELILTGILQQNLNFSEYALKW